MRIDSLKAHGFASLDDVDLNLREVPSGLIAIVGPNGCGKTSLLELVPGAAYRQLPSRNNDNPVEYATQRDSFLDVEYTTDEGSFRLRLNLDGTKCKADGVLEQIRSDGSRIALNDGKISTLDEQISKRFPSIDLYLNSAFAAQGRGDEFTRRKPSQRKDLFTEFLGLKSLLLMARTASEAAALATGARERLAMTVAHLEDDTDPRFGVELDRLANELQASGGEAELQQRALKRTIAELEDRIALVADQAAAYAAAQSAVRSADEALTRRRAELQASRQARAKAATDARAELQAVDQRRTAALADITKRIAGNQQLRDESTAIRAAVAAIATIDGQLLDLREREQALRTRQTSAAYEQQLADAAVHAFTTPQLQLTRARTDAALLADVPCGGAGEYAACQFLKNATAAESRIAELEATVAGVAAAIDRAAAAKAALAAIAGQVADVRAAIARLEGDRTSHQAKAQYEKPLIDAEARLAELQQKQADVEADHLAQSTAAHERHAARILDFDMQDQQLTAAIAELEREHTCARADLEATAAGNSQVAELRYQLALERAMWDQATTRLATVKSGHEELARRRQELADKQARLVDARGRLARIDQEFVEWQDLAKALGKGGLPDLEIDHAGPDISARCNQLLLATYGPRFSIELVTQVAKSDGSGMKDEFTVRVLDNEKFGGWRDIGQLSGGQKVIVQEALMCAICLFVNERSPMPMRTLFRDETGAALDAENAMHYVAMLRKVRELGGFHHVLFVTHNADAAALADAQVQVGGGQARIVLAPFSEAA